ncbi:MAG: aquaporin family protein [Alphaproteobacteria bacterium]|nr:aquaporin family protein [Alphaproteobacteria bacterium]
MNLRALAAEALGTLFLVAAVVGSGIMAERLAGGNVAIALLGNTLATGAILTVLIIWLGPISGAHFNPAVSLAFALTRGLAWRLLPAYWIAQCLGGIAGTLLAHAMFELPAVSLATTVRAGDAQWLSEGVATFGLVATIFGTLRASPSAVAPAVGLYIAAGYWFTASTSFANPAVTLARTLSDSFSGIRPEDAPPFVAAQAAGAVLAVLVMAWLLGPARARQPSR